MPTFFVHTPVGVESDRNAKGDSQCGGRSDSARASCARIRCDSLTGENRGDNLGDETPVMHFEQWEQDEIEVR